MGVEFFFTELVDTVRKAQVLYINPKCCYLLSFTVASKLNQLNNLRDENEELKCQIEVYKNEVAVLKQENSSSSSDRDREFRSLQMAMQGMQQVWCVGVCFMSLFKQVVRIWGGWWWWWIRITVFVLLYA